MKKIFAGAILTASFFAAQAQSGTVILGGDVSYSSSKQGTGVTEVKTQNLNLNPYLGYQFNDNWTAGVVAGIGTSTQEQGSNESKFNDINAGPFLRYTQPVSDIFSLYGQLEGRFGSRKSKNNGTTIGEANSTTVNLFPAAFINLKNNFGLNFNFGGLTYGSTKPDGGTKSTNFNINFGRVGAIGISKNFGGSSKK